MAREQDDELVLHSVFHQKAKVLHFSLSWYFVDRNFPE